MRPRDTDKKAWDFQMALIRRLTPEEKLQRTVEFTESIRQLCLSGIRKAHPQASEEEIFRHFARQTLGKELYAKAYGRTMAAGGRA